MEATSAMKSNMEATSPDHVDGNQEIEVILKTILLLVGFCAWAAASRPPPPSPKNLDITSPWIKLRDGRHLSYLETGVPKETAISKIIYVHCFDCSQYHNPLVVAASPALIQELGVYIVALDRPGYGESDPDPKRTVKSLALDIEELAHLKLGPKFYVAGFSMGGEVVWSCLKYIPHRLQGAILIAPVVNYWWPNLPSNLTKDAYSRQLQQDQWAMRVAHYLPSLTYWWNTQKMFPSFALIDRNNTVVYSSQDLQILSTISTLDPNQVRLMQSRPRLQGEYESLHRDLNIGFGNWELDPMDLENPFPNNNGSVHLWMGDEDRIVPLTLQRYIAQQLGWINYHEVVGGGHMMAFGNGVADTILKSILGVKH